MLPPGGMDSGTAEPAAAAASRQAQHRAHAAERAAHVAQQAPDPLDSLPRRCLQVRALWMMASKGLNVTQKAVEQPRSTASPSHPAPLPALKGPAR